MTVVTQLRDAGRLLLDLGLAGRARAVFDRLLELGPEDREAQIGIAECLLLQGEAGDALAILQNLDDDDPTVLRARSTAALEAGDGGAARAALERLQTFTDQAVDPLMLAFSAFLEGDVDLCRAHVETALGQEPKRLAALEWSRRLESLGTSHALLVDLARHHLGRGATMAALDVLDDAANAGDSAGYRTIKAKALILSADFDSALGHLKESIGAYPDDPDLRSELGAVLLILGRTDEAGAELDQVLVGHDPPQSALVRRGQVAVLAEDAEMATRLGDMARSNDPTDPEAWLVSAQAAFLRGHRADGRLLADHAVALNPTDPTNWAETARLIRASDQALADRYAQRALAAVGSNEALEPTPMRAIDAELNHLEGILDGRPEFGHAYADRTLIYEHLAEFERALAFQEAAWRQSPELAADPDSHVQRGMLLAAAGAAIGAAASFGRALTIDSGHGVASEALGALEVLTNG